MGKDKRAARVGSPPASAKAPRGEKPGNFDGEPIAWHLRHLDREGPWGWGSISTHELWNVILPKARDFESMTWGSVKQGGSHSIDLESITSEARKRLQEIGQDDVDELFSLRLRGKERLWGIRDRHILKVLWWDPKHQICPSTKKHT